MGRLLKLNESVIFDFYNQKKESDLTEHEVYLLEKLKLLYPIIAILIDNGIINFKYSESNCIFKYDNTYASITIPGNAGFNTYKVDIDIKKNIIESSMRDDKLNYKNAKKYLKSIKEKLYL